MKLFLFITLFVINSNAFVLYAMPGSDDSGEEAGDEEEGGSEEAGGKTVMPKGVAQVPGKSSGMPSSTSKGSMGKEGSAQVSHKQISEPIVESKRLEGQDISKLEQQKAMVVSDNPIIARLSTEMDQKFQECDQKMEQVVHAINQQQQLFRDITVKRKKLYQNITAVMGELKELDVPPHS